MRKWVEVNVGTLSMAQKKKAKKTSRLQTSLFYILVPVVIWVLSFIAWLYWDNLTKVFSTDSGREQSAPRATRKLDNADKSTAPTKRSPEKILDEDRKKLEDILKQRQ
ncbi:MAG TPA: hypothetical protein VMZ02_07055 [Candidatus Limnocylindrales bacterium]|nr:hypothetical protein [Candidatus Limnocylindrales bacterium]